MNPVLIKPAVFAVAVAIAAAVAFAVGYAVSSWRNGAEIARLQSDKTVVSSANEKCQADVKNVRRALVALEEEARERSRLAEESMREAQPKVETRTAVITKIKAMPVVQADAQCEAIKREQAEYVAWRQKL